ncbi:MAG: helix-turn-helix domain-containing protein [Saprospiraceae bacterium]|nr:helix-turn-helix domain-containing protein [Saprospiraceae bacterium]
MLKFDAQISAIRQKQEGLEEGLIEKIQKIVKENLHNPKFSTGFLCDELHISRSQLHRRIKQHSGLSTSLFIRKIKLAIAKEHLEGPDHNISEIAYLSGIDSPQNFSKYFVEEYGITPSMYRKQFREELREREITNSELPKGESVGRLPFLSKIGTVRKYLYYSIISLAVISVMVFIFSETRTKWKATQAQVISDNSHFENSIAVLPFENVGSEVTNFFTDGIVEDILTNLAYFADLKVISRTSSMTYKNTLKGIKEIAKELKVAYLLEGSVRQIEDEVKVTAQLIRTADDFHVWAKNYTKKVEDIFQLQSEISMDIALALNQRISAQVSERISPASPVDFQAYNEFLIGRNLLMSRTEQGIKEGIRRFDIALDIDPGYSKALAFKANAYQLLANLTYEDREENNSIAEALALEAIKLDTKNGLAYATLGSLYKDQKKWRQSETSFEIALKYSPNDALTNYWYSLLLREIGQVGRSVIYSTRAIELDPLYPVIYAGHIVNCMYSGADHLVDKLIKEGEVLFTNSFMYHWAIAKNNEYNQDYQAAILQSDRALSLNPGIPSIDNARVFCLGRLGHHQEVLSFIDTREDFIAEHYIARAVAYSALNDVEASLSYLKSAADSGVLPTDIKVDPKFDLLRGHPEFILIMQKFGLTDGIDSEDQEH